MQTLANTCITGPGQTRCEPGTCTLLFHWWRPAGRVKPTPLRTMHLRHLRGSRQKARRGSIDASLCPVTPGISHRDRFTLGGRQRKLAGGNPDRMLSGTPLGFLDRDPRIVAKALAGIRTLAVAAELGQGPGESETFR